MGREHVIIFGNDALVERVRLDLAGRGFRANVLHATAGGVRDALVAAGVESAFVLLALDSDHRTNLEAALEAREVNPAIRIVMRQFNRTLGRKIAGQLENCAVVSLASVCAATYAAAALEPDCFFALEFPSGSRELVGFVRSTAEAAGIAGRTVADSEGRLGVRILSRGDAAAGPDRILDPAERVEMFGPVARFAARSKRKPRPRLARMTASIRTLGTEFDPLLRVLVAAGLAVFVLATIFFAAALRLNPVTAAYFVTETMTTVGYGDIAFADRGMALQSAAMVLMIAGFVIANLSTGFVSAALVRAQLTGVQGLRRIYDTGHVVVFGAGRVGTRVIDYLCELGTSVTVVDIEPMPELVRRAREREITLLTGDASLDETLDLSNVREARSTVVVTDDDGINLEIGLGARARQKNIPVIMQVVEPAFAASMRSQFEIRRTFSPAELAWPVFADLVMSDAARGRVSLAGTAFYLEEREFIGGDSTARPIAAARGGAAARAVGGWDEVRTGDIVLTLSEERR